MIKLIFGLVIYMVFSECLAIINLIKLFVYALSESKEKYPVLYADNIITNIVLFSTFLWLPYIIIRKIKDEL